MNEIENKSKEIIADLIILDPELKDIEAELNKLVIKFIKNKPNITIGDTFEQELRSNLINEARVLKEKSDAKKIVFDRKIFIKKLSFSFGAVILAVLIIFPGINLLKGNSSFLGINKLRNKKVNITKLEDTAFGKLAKETFPSDSMTKGLMQASPIGLAEDSMSLGEIRMLNNLNTLTPYDNYHLSYVYQGDDMSQIVPSGDKINVYTRASFDYNNSSLLKSIISLFDSAIDLNKFNNKETKLSRLSLIEDKDFAYEININLSEGSLFLTQYRDKWPQASNQLKYEELLSNEELIEIAQDFLIDLGVNMNNYAKAVINYDFHEVYKNSENKEDLYIPEETIVNFPFVIDGKEVKDESVNPYGLMVSVSSQHKKVTELSNFYFSNYQSSAYDALNDVALIKETVEQSGLDNYLESPEINEIIVTLGTPSIILSKQDRTNDGYKNSQELFLPSLSFPVLKLSEKTDFFTKKYIVIPLVKELIDTDN